MPKLPVITFACFLLNIVSAPAQTVYRDTTSDIAQRNLLNVYFNNLGENAHLYNGSEFAGYGQNIGGHPFFESDILQNGSILYDGVWYNDIPMWYDLAGDQVVIKDYTGNYYIRLVREKIRLFSVLQHTFVYVHADSTTIEKPEDGFYDQLYDGNVAFLVRRKKQLRYSTTVEKVSSEFIQYNTFYLRKDGRYFKVSNKAGVLRMLKDKKTELRKFYAEKKLRFKSDPELTILQMVQYYDHLKK